MKIDYSMLFRNFLASVQGELDDACTEGISTASVTNTVSGIKMSIVTIIGRAVDISVSSTNVVSDDTEVVNPQKETLRKETPKKEPQKQKTQPKAVDKSSSHIDPVRDIRNVLPKNPVVITRNDVLSGRSYSSDKPDKQLETSDAEDKEDAPVGDIEKAIGEIISKYKFPENIRSTETKQLFRDTISTFVVENYTNKKNRCIIVTNKQLEDCAKTIHNQIVSFRKDSKSKVGNATNTAEKKPAKALIVLEKQNGAIMALYEKGFTNLEIGDYTDLTQSVVYEVLKKAHKEGRIDLNKRPKNIGRLSGKPHHTDKDRIYKEIAYYFDRGFPAMKIKKIVRVGQATIDKALELHTSPGR